MAEIVLGALGPVVQFGQCVWTPMKRVVSYTVFYKRNLQSLDVEVKKLEPMWSGLKEAVDLAKMSGDRIKPEVQAWLIAADKAMVDARELFDEVGAGEKCFIGWCPDPKWRYSLGKKALKLTTTLNKLVEEAKFETLTLEIRRPPEVQHLISTEGFEAFEATRQAMDRVMNALENDEVTTIGVYGMGGIGKTTLVKQVGAQVCKDGLFDLMIMAVFSQNPVVMQIQDQLKDMLALKLEETTEITIAARLKERILRGKILIVLDDIWKTIDLSIIGIPSHDDLQRCGSKVIFTTRNIHVCHDMGSQVRIPVNLLSEDDSWNLFVKNARKPFESTTLCEVAKQVARECGGLPVALVTVARALQDKEQLEEWKEAALRLKMSQPASLDDDGGVLKCIKLSYDYLKDEDAKSCFLLCCLFPEDSDIFIYDLIKYGLGKGLFRDAATFEEARSRVYSVINYLKAFNLLLECKNSRCVRMHDVIRDMALSIASSEYGDGFFVKAGTQLTVWPSNAYQGHSAISLMENDIRKLPEELECPNLQMLLLQGNKNIKEIPETFFGSQNELKVLDLSSTGISILPRSLSLLTNLHSLYLDYCKSISSVSLLGLGELKKLEILSLIHSALEELPEEIGNLAKLRMLDLTHSGSIKRIPAGLISRLSRLEELYMQGSFQKWGSKVEGEGEQTATNVGFDELISLSYLNNVEVDIRDAKCLPENVSIKPNWDKFHIRIGGKRSSDFTALFPKQFRIRVSQSGARSRELIRSGTVNPLPSWFDNAVSQRAQRLTYKRCEALRNVPAEYDTGSVNGLETLVVEKCCQVVTLMDTTRVPNLNKPVFENLQGLSLLKLDNLKELSVGELPEGSLGKLKYLEAGRCSNLLNPLLPSTLLQRLQSLEVLCIGHLPLVEYVFRSEDFDHEQIDMRHFRELRLSYLPQLENIWRGPATYEIFCNLQRLDVTGCDKLKYIFTADVSRSLLQLETLELSCCSYLETIFGPGEDETVIIFPRLKNLMLNDLPQLTTFYTGNNGIECPSLEYLTVMHCPRFPTSAYNVQSRNRVTIRTR